MKLFAVYVGGEAKGANIELHDMRFVVGERIEDTFDALKQQWWGIAKSLHLDCWAELTHADGHRIELRREPPPESAMKLYYVNVGGYDAEQFIELHRNIFVVAESPSKAKVRALKSVRHWKSFHKDDLYEAEQCYDLTKAGDGWFIHLSEDASAGDPPFTCMFKRIG